MNNLLVGTRSPRKSKGETADVQRHFALWKTFRGIAITLPGIMITLPAILIKLIGITPE
jgi:hypothetical protein